MKDMQDETVPNASWRESAVHRTRQKCVDGGVEFALSEQPRPRWKRKLDGRRNGSNGSSDAPTQDQKRWTMQMLTARLVELRAIGQYLQTRRCDEC
ncbi:MAG: hypothetical protein CLLPBCKN_004093 [Chroococcidiopsis cubana SAG 39.79]|nr:hypothetical protein [Chroococcidiopsis cubana]MDZ4874697.1 hypothetical protein [Chroococcidiopsis cubana SAG 39.79]